MRNTYLNTRISEALNQAGREKQKAADILTRWMEEDDLLKDGIISKFLPGAVAYHIQRVDHAREDRDMEPVPSLKNSDLKTLTQQLQDNLKIAETPEDTKRINRPAPKASQTHQNALHNIAKAFTKKRLDPDPA
jgi:hypothetical protein